MPEPYQLPAATEPEVCIRCHVRADTTLVFEGPPQMHLDLATRLGVPIPDDATSRMARRAAERADGKVSVALRHLPCGRARTWAHQGWMVDLEKIERWKAKHACRGNAVTGA